MKRVEPRQQHFVFADSPQGSEGDRDSGVPEGRSFLLHRAKAGQTIGSTASVTAPGEAFLPGFEIIDLKSRM